MKVTKINLFQSIHKHAIQLLTALRLNEGLDFLDFYKRINQN